MVAHSFNLAFGRQEQEHLCEFKTRLYEVSFRQTNNYQETEAKSGGSCL